MSTQNIPSPEQTCCVEYMAWNTPRIVNDVTRKARYLGVSIEDPTKIPYLGHETDDAGLRRLYTLVTEAPKDAEDKKLQEAFERKLFDGLARRV